MKSIIWRVFYTLVLAATLSGCASTILQLPPVQVAKGVTTPIETKAICLRLTVEGDPKAIPVATEVLHEFRKKFVEDLRNKGVVVSVACGAEMIVGKVDFYYYRGEPPASFFAFGKKQEVYVFLFLKTDVAEKRSVAVALSYQVGKYEESRQKLVAALSDDLAEKAIKLVRTNVH